MWRLDSLPIGLNATTQRNSVRHKQAFFLRIKRSYLLLAFSTAFRALENGLHVIDIWQTFVQPHFRIDIPPEFAGLAINRDVHVIL